MEPKSPRHEYLAGRGWQRKFAASEPRLSEARVEYEGLGFEVLFEPVDLGFNDESSGPADESCETCLMDGPNRVMVIYARPKRG